MKTETTLTALLLATTAFASKVIPPYGVGVWPDAKDLGGNPRKVDTQSKGYLELPLSRRNAAASNLYRRATTNPASAALKITSDLSGYTAALQVGTPAQTLNLILDTGSPLTWLSSTNVTSFTPSGDPAGETSTAIRKEVCTSNGCFDSTKSSSYSGMPNEVFEIQYVDNTEAIGEIVEDTADFAGLTVAGFQFGLVTYQYNPEPTGAVAGIIGLGPVTTLTSYPTLADAIGPEANTTDTSINSPTLLNQFSTAGAISTTAFSLYLNAQGNGSVLLGGVDHSKYSGDLIVVPIPSLEDAALQVTLLSVGFNGSTSASEKVTLSNVITVLDSGTTAIYLPTSVIQLVTTSLGGTVVGGQPSIPCANIKADTTVDFYFQNGALVRTPVELLVDSVARSGSTQTCRLGMIATSESDYYLLGDYFLRSAYVVYNFAEAQIAIAQVKYDDAGSNISTITTGTYGIPGGVYNGTSTGSGSVATVSGISQPWSETRSGSGTTASGTTSEAHGKVSNTHSVGSMLALVVCVCFGLLT